MTPLRRFAGDECGATIVEYALCMALFALLTIAGMTTLANNANGRYNQQTTATANYQLNP